MSIRGAPSMGNGPRTNREGGGVSFIAAEPKRRRGCLVHRGRAQKKAAQSERLKFGPEGGHPQSFSLTPEQGAVNGTRMHPRTKGLGG